MGRKPIDPLYKKVNITISLPKWLIHRLKQEKGYNNLIYNLLSEHFKDGKKG